MNISTWRNGGFKHWLRDQENLADQQARRDMALAYAQRTGCSLDEALCQASLDNLYQLACKLDIDSLLKKMQDDPDLFLKANKLSVSLLEGVREFGVTLCWVGGCFQKMEFSSLRLTRAAEAWIFFACKACSPSLAATHFWNISHLTSRTPASILCSLLTVVPGGARRGVRRNSSASLCWLYLRPRIPSTS
jgi:hypothetical protein